MRTRCVGGVTLLGGVWGSGIRSVFKFQRECAGAGGGPLCAEVEARFILSAMPVVWWFS